MKPHFWLVMVAAAAQFGCSDAAGISEEAINIRTQRSGVIIQNGQHESIAYLVMDASFEARASWIWCVDANCPSVAPGQEKVLTPSEVAGWGESQQLTAYWWHVYRRADGTFYRDSVRAMPTRYTP